MVQTCCATCCGLLPYGGSPCRHPVTSLGGGFLRRRLQQRRGRTWKQLRESGLRFRTSWQQRNKTPKVGGVKRWSLEGPQDVLPQLAYKRLVAARLREALHCEVYDESWLRSLRKDLTTWPCPSLPSQRNAPWQPSLWKATQWQHTFRTVSLRANDVSGQHNRERTARMSRTPSVSCYCRRAQPLAQVMYGNMELSVA